ncbi:MAG: HD domain-containing protein [Proteobacteria bacterium]|nr:HD domain-containing protein [Pseudomonadota bacterium]
MTLDESAAAAFAIRAHGDQRYGDQPYVSHLVAVSHNLRRFGQGRIELVCAAWLHDTVEDTPVRVEEVRELFGPEVAAIVDAVTTQPGPNRKARNALTYPRIVATPGAVTVKLADRIANVEACWASQSYKLFRYRDEYPAFREAMRDDANLPRLVMWDHLDTLLGWRP